MIVPDVGVGSLYHPSASADQAEMVMKWPAAGAMEASANTQHPADHWPFRCKESAVTQIAKALSAIFLVILSPGVGWTAEWRTLRTVERWQLQETEGQHGRKFRILNVAMDPGDFTLIYRCDRIGTDNITLVRKQQGSVASDVLAYELRYETGAQVRSLAVNSNGRTFSFRRGTPPYRQIFQDLMRSNVVTFDLEGTRRSFLVAGFMEAAGKLQVQCRSRLS
jgi:hypothetical protein